MSFVEEIKKLQERAEVEVREKRIMSGMDLHELKKENYVVLSANDYNRLINAVAK